MSRLNTIASLVIFVVLTTLPCCSTDKDGQNSGGPDIDTADGSDVAADSAAKVDQSSDSVVPEDIRLDLNRIETSGDAPEVENSDSIELFPISPIGPLPGLWDCSADWDDSIGRISPVQLDCIIDPECTDKMVVAHRGAGGQIAIIAPENSLAGIRAAIIMGVDGVELDVRHTSDNEFVLMHDDSLKRTTGVDQQVDAMTLEEVLAVPLLAPESKYTGDFSCEYVPSFTEAMELVRGRLFVDLDCKTSRTDLIAQRIVELDMVDQVFISVSNVQAAVKAREAVPEIRIQIRPDSMDEVQESFELFARPAEIFEVPWDLVLEAVEPVHAVNSKLFADVFGQDAVALMLGDFSVYGDIYDQGADVLQSEYPTFLLMLLDRVEWESTR